MKLHHNSNESDVINGLSELDVAKVAWALLHISEAGLADDTSEW
jgi:hypothetical protein